MFLLEDSGCFGISSPAESAQQCCGAVQRSVCAWSELCRVTSRTWFAVLYVAMRVTFSSILPVALQIKRKGFSTEMFS